MKKHENCHLPTQMYTHTIDVFTRIYFDFALRYLSVVIIVKSLVLSRIYIPKPY